MSNRGNIGNKGNTSKEINMNNENNKCNLGNKGKWGNRDNIVTEETWVIEGNKGNVTLIFSSISFYLETDMLFSLPMLHLISLL